MLLIFFLQNAYFRHFLINIYFPHLLDISYNDFISLSEQKVKPLYIKCTYIFLYSEVIDKRLVDNFIWNVCIIIVFVMKQ